MHFPHLTILPKFDQVPTTGDREEAIHEIVNDLMSDYDEGKPVPEYDRDCDCIYPMPDFVIVDRFSNWYNRDRLSNDQIVAKLSELTGFSEVTVKSHKEMRPLHEFLQRRSPREEACYEFLREVTGKQAALKGREKTDCEDCHGTFKVKTNYNEDAKWDWWRIGGRWDGEMFGHHRLQGPSNERDRIDWHYSDELETLDRNYGLVGDLRKRPMSILTPDGFWHDPGAIGFILTGDQEEKWSFESGKILGRYKGHYAVGIDCHI